MENPEPEIIERDSSVPVDWAPETLAEAVADLGLEISPEQINLIDKYRELLWQWNEQINLTRHTTLAKFVARDLIDSWQIAQLIEIDSRVLDIGTGGGVPGVIVAILRPDLTVHLCESTIKKANVVNKIIEELELEIDVYPNRAEEVLQTNSYNTLTARGVAPLNKLLTWFAPYWNKMDQLLLIKGKNWLAERGKARHYSLLNNLELRKAATYMTPGTDAQSVILAVTEKED